MKIIIEDHCIRCGICIDTAPDLFERATEDDVIKVKVEHIDGPLQESAREAADGCAVGAIVIVE